MSAAGISVHLYVAPVIANAGNTGKKLIASQLPVRNTHRRASAAGRITRSDGATLIN